MESTSRIAHVSFCVLFFVYGAESVCEIHGQTYNAGEIWQETEASGHPDCFQHLCLPDGTVTTSKCDPAQNDVEADVVAESDTTTVSPTTTTDDAITTTELSVDNQLIRESVPETGCTIDDREVAVGEQVDVPGRCYYRACAGNNQWIMKACGLIGLAPGWILTPEDPSRAYPACCGQAKPLLDIIPDVIRQLQWSLVLRLLYDNVTVDYGGELTPSQVRGEPTVAYTGDPGAFYLLAMVDPDAPSRQKPESREFLHWLVGNIPGDDVSSGDTLAEYVGSGPPQGSGLHRYVFVLYKQPGNITFDGPVLNNTSVAGRRKFSISHFAQNYSLGDPVSMNFFVAQYDDYVPEVHKQLGIQLE